MFIYNDILICDTYRPSNAVVNWTKDNLKSSVFYRWVEENI